MLHLIPPPVHRACLRLAHALRKRWWRLCKPHVRGCRVLAIDGAGNVLLIRHSYGSGQWMMPGGGVGRREAALAAASRELREETGCRIADPMQVALLVEPLHGASNAVQVIAGRAIGVPAVDRREVIAAAFFPPDGLPDDMPPRMRSGLPGWVGTYRAGQAARRRGSPAPALQQR